MAVYNSFYANLIVYMVTRDCKNTRCVFTGYVFTRRVFMRAVALAAASLIVLLLFVSCTKKVKKRPYGYFRLGPVAEYLAPETRLEKFNLLLRRDEGGLYVMSTVCTHDLTYLLRKTVGEEDIFVSQYTASKYDINGKVISGPATADLPYYELKIDAGVYGGPKDTLYAYIGKEVSREWRLKVPDPVPAEPQPETPPSEATPQQ